MLLAVTAVACLPLFVFALVSVVTIASGLGLIIAPKALLAVRWQADLERRRALEWSGVTIAAPYRPEPKSGNRLVRGFRRGMWVLSDPATWRDLLWTAGRRPGQRGARAAARGPGRRRRVEPGGRRRDTVLRMVGAVAPHGFTVAGVLPVDAADRRPLRTVVPEDARPGRLVAAGADPRRRWPPGSPS